MSKAEQPEAKLVISYLTLRRAIGFLGIGLPFVVSIGAGIQSSISAYYYTVMRDVFVGTLCAIGVFLFSYKGYEPKDDVASNLAGLFAVGIALFPTSPCDPISSHCPFQLKYFLHGVFAVLLFGTFTYMSLFLFTKTDLSKKPTGKKLQRNSVYRACGYVMLSCLVAVPAASLLLPEDLGDTLRIIQPVFWLESIAVVAFGISWLTKGEAILKDES
jgi:hypothetical protein